MVQAVEAELRIAARCAASLFVTVLVFVDHHQAAVPIDVRQWEVALRVVLRVVNERVGTITLR